MRRRTILTAMSLAITLTGAAHAAYVPITVTGYNQDLVVEATAPASPAGTATTASMDAGVGNTGDSWYEQGYNAGALATGLPVAGSSAGSVSGLDHSFTFAPTYAGSNTILLDTGHTAGSFALSNPLQYSSLSILTSSGQGSGTIGYTVHYADGSTSVGSFVSPDWFNSAPIAVNANGRVDVQNGTSDFDSVNSGNPRLYQVDIALTNTLSAVTSVDLNYISGTSGITHTAVMAVSGTPALEVTAPGDSVRAFNSSGSPATEGVEHAIDNDRGAKYLSFTNYPSPGNVGLEVYPNAGLSVVKALVLTSGNDAPDRDPTSYVIEGSNDGGASWTAISGGAVGEFATRGATRTIDISANNAIYGNYRVYFPAVDGSNIMQIGEVELVASEVFGDLTRPGNPITGYNFGSSPGGEGVANAIDNNSGTKYLATAGAGSGLTVLLDQPSFVFGVGLRTANDTPSRDPASFTLQGSNDGTNFFDIVSNVAIPAIGDRFFERNFYFENDIKYLYYRLFFPTLAGGGGEPLMQIGEVQLFGTIPAPAALPAGLALLSLVSVRRSRR